MNGTGFSDVIEFGDREIHIETDLDRENQRIVVRVQDNSFPLSAHEIPTEDTDPADAERLAEIRHRETVSEWRHFSRLLEKVLKSRHAPSAVRMGRLLLSRNLFPEAVDCFRSALRWDPDNVEAVVNLARAYYQSELYDETIELLNSYRDRFAEYPDLYFWLGAAELQQMAFQQAIHHLERALELNSHYDAAHFLLCKTYVTTLAHAPDSEELIPSPLRQKKAMGHLQRAMDLNPVYGQAAGRQAMKEIQNGRYEEALRLLEEIPLFQQEGDNHFDERFYLEFLFGGKSKDDRLIEEYIAHLREQIQEHPDFPDLHNRLGVAYLIQCRNMFLKAMDQFRKALKLNPQFKSAERNLKLAENEGKGFIILLRALLK